MKNNKEKRQNKKRKNTEIEKLICEFNSLKKDLETYKKSIQKIKNAPKDKNAIVVGPQQKELVTELENIAKKLKELPQKWKKEIGSV